MRGFALIRYVGTIYAGAIALTTSGLTLLVVAASMIEGGGELAKAGAGVGTVLKLAGFNGLAFSYQILPAASFLGALIAGTLLARRGELLGVQASGIGMGPIWTGFVSVALLVAVVGYGLGEWVVPRAVEGLARTQAEELEGRSDGLSSFYTQRSSWFRSGDRVLYLPARGDGTRFESPVIYETVDGALRTITEAQALRHRAGGWELVDAVRFDVESGDTLEQAAMPLALEVSPEDITRVTGDPRQMSVGQIASLIERRERAGFDSSSHRIEFHNRLAYPANALWMLLIALPWALHPDRRRSLAVNLGAGVVVIAVLFVVTYLFRILALGHKLPVALGAYGIFTTCLVLVPTSALLYRRYRIHGGLW